MNINTRPHVEQPRSCPNDMPDTPAIMSPRARYTRHYARALHDYTTTPARLLAPSAHYRHAYTRH